MSDTSSYYRQCPGCGKPFGRGKGWDRLARHECDLIRPFVAQLFKHGVQRGQLAFGFERSVVQIEALLRSMMR